MSEEESLYLQMFRADFDFRYGMDSVKNVEHLSNPESVLGDEDYVDLLILATTMDRGWGVRTQNDTNISIWNLSKKLIESGVDTYNYKMGIQDRAYENRFGDVAIDYKLDNAAELEMTLTYLGSVIEHFAIDAQIANQTHDTQSGTKQAVVAYFSEKYGEWLEVLRRQKSPNVTPLQKAKRLFFDSQIEKLDKLFISDTQWSLPDRIYDNV